MTPEEIKTLRRATGMTQRELAEALDLDVAIVRDWEQGERFPTKDHCDQMVAIAQNPPPKKNRKAQSPMEVLGDPGFFALVRKLIAHDALRRALEKLAAEYPDPLHPDD